MIYMSNIKVLTISSLLVLGQFFTTDHTIKHQKQFDALKLKNCQSVMIVAHPDDETIWGGNHLMKRKYLVVCLTNGDNKVRRKEFMNVMKATHNTGIILDYPDKTNGERDNWNKVRNNISNDIHYVLGKKKWKTVVTHNPDGEYGHIHHKMTSYIVRKQDNVDMNQLVYFGKYYKKKNLPKNLDHISKKDLTNKIALTKMYGSQSKVMDHLGHMFKYENFVKAKDWR